MKQLTAIAKNTLPQWAAFTCGLMLIALFLPSDLNSGPIEEAEKMETTSEKKEKEKDTQQNNALRDAWLQGKLETVYALNKHLNPFDIDTEVKNGKAYLEGVVESEVHKDLAEELAVSIEGISRVENKLQVDRQIAGLQRKKEPEGKRKFSQVVEDVTTTASVKSKLLFGVDLEGNALKINVDTRNGLVVLQGDVDTAAIKELAGKAAENVAGVHNVQNNLKVPEES